MATKLRARFFSDYQEWIEIEGTKATVGLTPEALVELEEIVFIELPKVGVRLSKNERIAILETTKAAIDLYAPLSGKIIAVNDQLEQCPSLVNSSPEKEGWIYQLEISDLSEVSKLRQSIRL